MKQTFVETRVFTARMKARLDDEAFRALQNALMTNPQLGDPMPGCGGLRKVRWSDPSRGKGKRGGVRVIYLNIPEVDRIDLITVYGKDEKDDLSASERKVLRRIAEEAKAEALAVFRAKGRSR